jgi:hypothetical protein
MAFHPTKLVDSQQWIVSDDNGTEMFTASHLPLELPLGTFAVTHKALVDHALASCSYKIVVVDEEPPIITFCPGNLAILSSDPNGALLTAEKLGARAMDAASEVTISYLNSSSGTNIIGRTQRPGDVRITVIARDSAGNVDQGSCSFVVSVVVLSLPAGRARREENINTTAGNNVFVISAAQGTLLSVPLIRDPRPQVTREGRREGGMREKRGDRDERGR